MAKHSSEEDTRAWPLSGIVLLRPIQPLLFELNRPLDDLEGMLQREFAGQYPDDAGDIRPPTTWGDRTL